MLTGLLILGGVIIFLSVLKAPVKTDEDSLIGVKAGFVPPTVLTKPSTEGSIFAPVSKPAATAAASSLAATAIKPVAAVAPVSVFPASGAPVSATTKVLKPILIQ